ncbi:MAG TPA: ATP-dependent Clp protease ATP-binding subunit [Candidatus Saccharimonadales bacterium]|nr:ATP-dependent Clp protease ATP-binding subunit [Candidatus Saccharimonadales bacterium]
MQPTTLNLNSPRARKSRYAQAISKPNSLVKISLAAVILILAGLGFVLLIIEENTLGLVLFVPAIVWAMIRWWYEGELKDLADDVDERSVDGMLEPQILARLKSATPSAFDVWQAANDTIDSRFFENRYMMHHSVFDELLDKNPGTAETVWKNAAVLREKYKTVGYPASVVIIALLKSIPDIGNLLKNVKMEFSDIELGIGWLQDIEARRRLANKRQSFGGLGRDWAYGYTPTLNYLGRNISEEIQYGGFFTDTRMHKGRVEQMIGSMSGGTQSVTLVGDVGVGKTTCVYAFAERILEDGSVPENIRYNQVVALDAPSLVAQAGGPGKLEKLVMTMLSEAQRAKNIILFFDDAEVFFGQGTASVDLSNLLIPALESGSNRLIFTMTPREWQKIGASNSSLASKFQPLQVNAAGEEDTLRVLRDKVLFLEYGKNIIYTHQSLREAYKLAGRYVDNQAMPGAALAVLKSAASASSGFITAEVVQRSIESTYGVKLAQATAQEKDVLLNMEDELHKYVINQKQAVSVIANALRRSRSGVGNPERPAGTFLFLGPTGVGKTELSKALARVYFGDEKSMIRVDMNQFVSPDDVNRLITPMLGEQLGFLGQVRRQPFSVILLDEIEKAHKNVVNLLLQMLDEGVMRDVDNKPVSFKDAIIIATSNAGADEIRRLISEGKDIAKLQTNLVDTIIERNIFAPELVNRFDEVVIFRPLTPDELILVIDLIIAGINKTMDAQKVQVELTQEAKKWLVEKGYDAKLGARPMRRVVQRYVENILAKRLLEQTAASGSKIKLDVNDFEAINTD